MERLELQRTQVIEAPNCEFEPREHGLFLAGGITDCPDWQQEMVAQLQDIPNLNIFNPRRAEFPMDDPNAAEEQIQWEFNYLKDASMISVWFSGGSLNPIVLYELGLWVNARPELPAFIGVDPQYTRQQDVIIQTKLIRPELEIVSSLGELADQVREHINGSTS